MLFNSLDFAVFLPATFLVYWFVLSHSLRLQNVFVVIASYAFYGWWDVRFLSLIIGSTLVDFVVSRELHRETHTSRRRILFSVSLAFNLGMLAVFKYYNFFVDSLLTAGSLVGWTPRLSTLDVVLPVGISFYTFQTLSYTIDVYQRRLKPTDDLCAFAAFVSFFPQLVAGPIERASVLLPQFQESRRFEYAPAVDGLKQMLWGFFKKMAIADNCAIFVDDVFENYSHCSSSTLAIGAVFFSIQIYGDFSGYSDIAIGSARLFGIRLNQNFAFPYFSRNHSEFWRRWHISLSSWFRDYVYIPLGGNSGTRAKRVSNLFVVFVLSGLWHGASWTFVAWGALHAALVLMSRLRSRQPEIRTGSTSWSLVWARDFLAIVVTFLTTSLAWVFFRAESLAQAFEYLERLVSTSLFTIPVFSAERQGVFATLLLIVFFFTVEWLGRRSQHPLERLSAVASRPMRWLFYYALTLVIISCSGNDHEFIYFRF